MPSTHRTQAEPSGPFGNEQQPYRNAHNRKTVRVACHTPHLAAYWIASGTPEHPQRSIGGVMSFRVISSTQLTYCFAVTLPSSG
jgi:hypothetical protein